MRFKYILITLNLLKGFLAPTLKLLFAEGVFPKHPTTTWRKKYSCVHKTQNVHIDTAREAT
jgi:hypothetical protein